MGETTEENEANRTRRAAPFQTARETKLRKEIPGEDSAGTSEWTRLAAPEQIRSEVPQKFIKTTQRKADGDSSSGSVTSQDFDEDDPSKADGSSDLSRHSSDYTVIKKRDAYRRSDNPPMPTF